VFECLQWVESRHKGEQEVVGMRRIAFTLGIVAILCLAGVLAAVFWVDRALAAAPRSHLLCMARTDREKIATGKFPSDRRDYFVSRSINFDQGVPRTMAWWHLRGAAIQLTYVSFWSAGKRSEIFNRLASQMRNCPPSTVA
jgi:hypothetical protein